MYWYLLEFIFWLESPLVKNFSLVIGFLNEFISNYPFQVSSEIIGIIVLSMVNLVLDLINRVDFLFCSFSMRFLLQI